MTTYTIIIVLALIAWVAIRAFRYGRTLGHNEGWCERHFDQIDRDNARRDAKTGRFKSPGRKVSHV